MAQVTVTIRSQQAAVYAGTGDVMCDERDKPHTWDVLLRCSPDELDLFQGLGAGQTVQVDVSGAGVGRAEFAAVEGTAHVRLTGLGLCPFPDHSP